MPSEIPGSAHRGCLAAGLVVLLVGCPPEEPQPDPTPTPAGDQAEGWPDEFPNCAVVHDWGDDGWGCSWGWSREQLCPETFGPIGFETPQEGPCPPLDAWASPDAGWVEDRVRVFDLHRLTPSAPVDFLGWIGPDDKGWFPESTGEPCGGATDGPACEQQLALVVEARGGQLFPSPPDFQPGVLVYTRGDEVGAIEDVQGVEAFLQPLSLLDRAFVASARDWPNRLTQRARRDVDGVPEVQALFGAWDTWSRTFVVGLREETEGWCVFAAAFGSAMCDVDGE